MDQIKNSPLPTPKYAPPPSPSPLQIQTQHEDTELDDIEQQIQALQQKKAHLMTQSQKQTTFCSNTSAVAPATPQKITMKLNAGASERRYKEKCYERNKKVYKKMDLNKLEIFADGEDFLARPIDISLRNSNIDNAQPESESEMRRKNEMGGSNILISINHNYNSSSKDGKSAVEGQESEIEPTNSNLNIEPSSMISKLNIATGELSERPKAKKKGKEKKAAAAADTNSDFSLNVDRNYLKRKTDNEFQENQAKFLQSQHPELQNLMSQKPKRMSEADEINLEVLDPVKIKFEGSTAKGMRGTIIITKKAIKDKKLIQWLENRELYAAWELEQKNMKIKEKEKTAVARTRRAAKQRALEEEKELRTCDITNDKETIDVSKENMKKV